MSDPMDPSLNRAIEKFRRVARSNVATKDISQAFLDELAAAGFTLVSAQQVATVETANSLLLRRAEKVERDGDQLEGLRLRLQAIGG